MPFSDVGDDTGLILIRRLVRADESHANMSEHHGVSRVVVVGVNAKALIDFLHDDVLFHIALAGDELLQLAGRHENPEVNQCAPPLPILSWAGFLVFCDLYKCT